MGGAGEPTTAQSVPWRVRQLPRRGRTVALVLALLLAVPYVVAFGRAVDGGWNPSNDDALIALRVHDVLGGEWPRLGQPSTAELYTGTDTLRHPGPIQFYLLAPLVGLLGADLALPLGAGAINLAAVLVAAWVVFRRAGPQVGLAATPVIGALAWAQGPVQLVDPISSNMGGIPMLALAVLAWAVADGDLRLLPLGALVLAFVAQQHLAVFGMAGGLAAWAVFGLVVTVLGWRRSRRSGPAPGPAAVAWIGGAVAVSVVAWLPVLADQVAGSGNLGRILTFAGSSDRPSLGWSAGLRQAARAVGVPPLVLRTDLTGDDVHAALSPAAWLAAAVVVGALVAVAVTDRSRRPARAALAVTVLIAATLGVVTGSNVPASVEAGRLNLFRWAFVVSALTWVVLGWAAVALVARRWPAGDTVRSGRLAASRPRVLGVLGGLALVGVTGAAVVGAGPRTWRDQEVFAAEEHLSAALLAEVAGHDRLLVVPVGSSAEFAVAPALVLDLVEAGHRFAVPPSQATGYGTHRVAVDAGAFDAAVVVVSGRGEAQLWPGRLVARVDLNEASAPARETIAAQVRGRPLVVSPDADAVLEALLGSASSPTATVFARFLDGLADDPDAVLRHPLAGRALEAGYFTAPALDPAAVRTLTANPPVESWRDDVIEVRVLDPGEIEEHWAALMAAGIGRPNEG